MDGGKIFLEVATVIPRGRDKLAKRLRKRYEQDTYNDLKRAKEVRVGFHEKIGEATMAEPNRSRRRPIRFELPPNPTDEEIHQAYLNIMKAVDKSKKKKKEAPSKDQDNQAPTR